MLAPCATCCVRKGAPERGGARRRCLPFLASFGLSKFGLHQHSNDGWKVPSARAAIYARRGAVAELRVARIERRADAMCHFFFRLERVFSSHANRPCPMLQRRKHFSGLGREGWYESGGKLAFRFQPVRRLPGLAAVPQGAEGLLLRYIRVVSHKHQLLLTPPFTNYCLVPSSSPSWVHP